MARMSGNDEFPSKNAGDTLQITNRILDYEETCLMTPEVSDSIADLLEHRDKRIEVLDRHHVTAKQKGQV